MNEYIVYTTDGYTSGPDIDIDVVNCQILGTIEGHSAGDAIKNLFAQNDWIRDAGYTMDNAFARPLLTPSIQVDIRMVVDYLWKVEHAHIQEGIYPACDIFCALKRLKSISL